MASLVGIELVSQLLSFGLRHLVGYLLQKKKKKKKNSSEADLYVS